MFRLGKKLLRYVDFKNIGVTGARGVIPQIKPCFLNFGSASALHNYDIDNHIKRIDQNLRKTGRISIKDLEEILQEIRAQKYISSSQSLLLLRCCGSLVHEESSEGRSRFVKEVLLTLNDINVPMDISHYNAILRVYLENEYSFSPIEFLEDLKSKGFEPNRVTYQRLIRQYCQQGDLDGATQILKFMQEKAIPVNEHVFNALIIGHSQANDIKSAKEMLNVIKQAGLEPSSETYLTLMCCLAKHGLVDDILSTLEECDKNKILISDKDLLEIVYSLAINSHQEKIPEILSKIQKSIGFNQDCINVILRLIAKKQEDIAYNMLKIMPRAVNENGEISGSGIFFIRQLVKSSTPISKIIAFCSDMKNNNLNSKSFEFAYETAIACNTIEAMEILKAMKINGIEIRQHFFWPLICQASNKDKALQILRQMIEHFDIQPNFETLRDYILPNLNINNTEQIMDLFGKIGVSQKTAAVSTAYWALSLNKLKETVQIMENYNFIYPINLFKNQLIFAISKSEDIDSCVQVLTKICSGVKSRESAVDFVGEVIFGYVKHLTMNENETQKIILILEKILEHNLGITNEFAEKIQNQMESEMNDKIANILSKLTNISRTTKTDKQNFDHMSIEEIESAIEKNLYPQKKKYLKQCLINACIKSKDITKIESVLNDLKDTGFEIFTGTNAQLIDVYCDAGELEKALNLYNLQKDKNTDFNLDRNKTLKLADLILKSGDREKALKLLVDNKKEDLEIDVSFKYKNIIWKLLNNLCETGDAELLKTVFSTLESNDYIIPTNIILGPLIKVHLKNDNINGALEAFTEICEKYRATPLKNELACRLIQQEDAVNLQKLTDLSTTIHGEVNSLYDLVFSFIECGRVRQARRILETPGLQNRSNRINNACERYKEEGDTKSLEALVEATSNINYIDRNLIYFNLLENYQKENDPQKALNLWTSMQEENIIPTDTFLIRLSKFLKENNINVPFVIPEELKKPENTSKSQQQITEHSTNFQSKLEPKHSELTKKLERRLKNNELSEASKIIADMTSKENQIPNEFLNLFINKVAENGDYKTIENLVVSNNVKKQISYDNKLCYSYIKAGKGKIYFERLCKDLDECNSMEEIDIKAKSFPRGGSLALLENHPELYDEYKILAEKYASYGIKGPVNILWMHNINNQKFQEADDLFKQYLIEEPRIMIKGILKHARITSDENIVNKLLMLTKNSNMSERDLRSIYICALDILTKRENLSQALSVLDEGIIHIPLENFSRNVLARLRDLCERNNVEIPHAIRDQPNTTISNTD